MARHAQRADSGKSQSLLPEIKREPMPYPERQSAGSSSSSHPDSSIDVDESSCDKPPAIGKDRVLMKQIASSMPPLPFISIRLVGVTPILSVSQLLNGGHEHFKRLVAVKGLHTLTFPEHVRILVPNNRGNLAFVLISSLLRHCDPSRPCRACVICLRVQLLRLQHKAALPDQRNFLLSPSMCSSQMQRALLLMPAAITPSHLSRDSNHSVPDHSNYL